MGSKLVSQQAVLIGAGVGGPAAAGALPGHFEQVLVLERDMLSSEPTYRGSGATHAERLGRTTATLFFGWPDSRSTGPKLARLTAGQETGRSEPNRSAEIGAVREDLPDVSIKFVSKGGPSVTKQTILTAILRMALAAGASLFFATGTAKAQKQGGSTTVGLELDIPGFDLLKVGVFDIAAQTAAAAIFDTLTYLDDKGDAHGQ